MALTTLPYPSLDFVPLDILTAEEMNQIVANYTAINNATIGTNQLDNSSITTPKLANKAVTSAKVDWATLLGSMFKVGTIDKVDSFTPAAWTPVKKGAIATVSGLDNSRTYSVIASTDYTEGQGEFRLYVNGASEYKSTPYNSTGPLIGLTTIITGIKPSNGKITLQRGFSGVATSTRWGATTFAVICTS